MSFSPKEVWKEFVRSKLALVGLGILAVLILMSVIALVAMPAGNFGKWNDPTRWLAYPKAASPAWINYFTSNKVPEHMVLEPREVRQEQGGVSVITEVFSTNYGYDAFPSDFIYQYDANYKGSPLLQISVKRPDGLSTVLLSTALPASDEKKVVGGMVFSTDNSVKKNIENGIDFSFSTASVPSQDLVFSETNQNRVQKGLYEFKATFYDVDGSLTLDQSRFIVGGKAYGLMGTDDLRRDLAVGLLWGTPLALFIGVTVSIGSVALGLLYGVYAGFKGGGTDEVMMRFNDIIYAMPALPLLIILAVTVGNSIFLIVGFLVVFGWVGIAKVSRSMAMQIKTLQFVEASKLMGQKDFKIIFKHVLPQLLPYAFASIAISVPAAITTEAGLSFLGLGDPAFPTWGQMLHDASQYGAAERGLWWWILPPGMMIAITGLAFVFIGQAMDAVVNPKLRR
ncbi:MAG: ABC transporter permease [Thaumarchaeota archaeon]|nr:ABC transporter permease [Nitrososphaerota archaeon]